MIIKKKSAFSNSRPLWSALTDRITDVSNDQNGENQSWIGREYQSYSKTTSSLGCISRSCWNVLIILTWLKLYVLVFKLNILPFFVTIILSEFSLPKFWIFQPVKYDNYVYFCFFCCFIDRFKRLYSSKNLKAFTKVVLK